MNILLDKEANFNNFFMEQALKQAKIAFDKNEVPVGAVIVDRLNQKIIASTHNNTEEKITLFIMLKLLLLMKHVILYLLKI